MGQIWHTACFYKVLLEHSHPHLFTYCPRLLSCHSGRAECLQQRLYVLESLKYLQSGFSQNKFAGPCSHQAGVEPEAALSLPSTLPAPKDCSLRQARFSPNPWKDKASPTAVSTECHPDLEESPRFPKATFWKTPVVNLLPQKKRPFAT